MHLSICLLDLYFQFTFWNLKKTSSLPFDYWDWWTQGGQMLFFLFTWFVLKEEEIEDTIGVIRIRKSEDRQHNGQKKKDKWTNNDLQNITHKTKDPATRTPLKTGGEPRCSGMVSSSCSTSDTRCVNLVTNSMINHEWGNDRKVFTTSGIYPWSFVTDVP